MKLVKHLLVVLSLLFTLSMPVLAGNPDTPGVTDPPPTTQPGNPDTPGVVADGNPDTPGILLIVVIGLDIVL